MIFWIGILVGGVFAWYAIKIGFLEVWTMLFNIVVSIYVAVFSTLAIARAIPAASDISFGYCFTMAGAGIATFLILGGISFTFLTGRFKVTFPKIFDNVASGIIGFLAGVLTWSFLVLLLSVTPLAGSDLAQSIGICGSAQQTHVRYVGWWCDLVNRVSSRNDSSSRQIIEQIAQSAADAQREKEDSEDPNAPQSPRISPNPTRRPLDDLGFGASQGIGHVPLSQALFPHEPPAA